MGNNRVYYGCLGVAIAAPNSFPSELIPGVQSVGITSQLTNEFITPIGSSSPSLVYSKAPDISFTFSEAFDTLQEITDIDGSNDYIDLFMFIGEDNTECMDARKYIRCRYLLLESVIYNLSTNGIFTREKTYKGFSRYICPTSSNITLDSCPGAITTSNLVGSRKNFDIISSSLPSSITNNSIQSISLKYNIAREVINEPGTRTPYGYMTKYPIETSCSFDLISQDLDSTQQSFATTNCEASSSTPINFTIATCGINNNTSSISISGAYINNINYAGGDAGGGNQSITIEYISYQNPGINPLVEFVNDPDTGC